VTMPIFSVNVFMFLYMFEFSSFETLYQMAGQLGYEQNWHFLIFFCHDIFEWFPPK
jgi:hypothetical protein